LRISAERERHNAQLIRDDVTHIRGSEISFRVLESEGTASRVLCGGFQYLVTQNDTLPPK